MGNLSNLFVSKSFQSLIHLATDNTASANLIGLEDGFGNPIGVSVNTAGNLSLSGSLTASLQSGYAWVGNSTGKTITVPTSSFGGGASVNTGSLLVTASAAGANITFTKGDASQFTITIATGSVTNAITASYVSGSRIDIDYIDFNTASATPAWKSGRVFWDNTDSCLAVYNAEADITLQVGQENWTRVFNGTGATILNGRAVRLSGTHGDVPEIALAQSIAISGSANIVNQILGLATHDIETNTFGFITTQGLVRGLNTNTFTDGATLYVSTSAGLLTTTAPPTPYEKIPIGQCVKAGPGASGIIYVAVEQPVDFSDLSSVVVGTYSDSDMWIYQGSGISGSWSHRNKASIGLTTTSSFNAATSSLFTSASLALTTASVNLNTITFTKGDGTTFPIVVNTGSAGGSGFPFTGNAVITGSLLVSGSSIPNVKVIGNLHITGSLVGQPIALSVSSNTASLNMTAGNNFVLTLPSSSTTHITATNLVPGQTLNLLVKQQVGPETGSITFAPFILFPSGLDMQATSTGSAIDLVSMISFDTTNLMAANVKNLK
jgi:hypothetical protein